MSNTMQTLRNGFYGPRRSTGIAAVEFVISVPLLIFFMLAVAELGRAFVQYGTLSYCVRNGARFVSQRVTRSTSGQIEIPGPVVAQARNLTVYGDVVSGVSPLLPDFATSQVTVRTAGNDNIEVVATYPYRPMIGGGLLPIYSGTAAPTLFTMRIPLTMRATSIL